MHTTAARYKTVSCVVGVMMMPVAFFTADAHHVWRPEVFLTEPEMKVMDENWFCIIVFKKTTTD